MIIFTLKCGNNTFTMSSLRRYFRFQKHPHIKRAWTHNSSHRTRVEPAGEERKFFLVLLWFCCYSIRCALTLRQKLFSKCGLVRFSKSYCTFVNACEYENPLQQSTHLNGDFNEWVKSILLLVYKKSQIWGQFLC